MAGNDDIDYELKAAIDEVLSALMNVPEVGKVYDQQHSDTQIKAYLRLKDAKEHSDAFWRATRSPTWWHHRRNQPRHRGD